MFIATSNKKGQPNWSGKEWSQNACKIYHEFQEISEAIRAYWFGGYNDRGYDHRQVIIRPITEKEAIKLIDLKKARY